MDCALRGNRGGAGTLLSGDGGAASHLSVEFVKAVRQRDERDGYRLVYVEDEEEVMGVAGFI
jgi:hypothetical protein